MSSNFGIKSLLLFITSVGFLVLLTLFEASLSGLSTTSERIISLLLLVFPTTLGVILGVLSVLRRESKTWIAVLGIVLNGLFAIFHILLLSFAG